MAIIFQASYLHRVQWPFYMSISRCAWLFTNPNNYKKKATAMRAMAVFFYDVRTKKNGSAWMAQTRMVILLWLQLALHHDQCCHYVITRVGPKILQKKILITTSLFEFVLIFRPAADQIPFKKLYHRFVNLFMSRDQA